MGLDNPIHLAFLVIILLLLFGARRLPEIGRSLGTGMREFKDSITGNSEPAPQQLQPPAQVQQPQPVQAQSVPVAQQPAPVAQQPVPVQAAQPVGQPAQAPQPVAQPAPTADEGAFGR